MIKRLFFSAIFAALVAMGLLFVHPAVAQDLDTTPLQVIEDPSYPVLQDIVFAGNKVTLPQTMLQEMTLVVGDQADPEKIEESRQAIMDLNLFKSVVVNQEIREEGVVLEIEVEEKYYILPLPTLDYSNDGDIAYGVNVKWYNMFGRNYTMKLKGKVKNYADGDTDSKEFIAFGYTMPRLYSGPWTLQLNGDYTVNHIFAPDDGHSAYKQEAWYLGFHLKRWYHLEGPSRGWFTRGGASIAHKSHELENGTPGLYEDGAMPLLSLGIGYKAVHDHLFSRTGKEFGYNFGLGYSPVDSEALFTTNHFYYRRYHWLFGKRHHNLNYQLQAAFASDSQYREYSYKLGSSKTLRGYKRDSHAGNAYLLANVEYLHPLLDNAPIRGVIFTDIGNSWQSVEDIDPTEVEIGVGFGVRAKVKYFVKLDLVLECAFSSDGESKVYGGSSLPF
ncbi:MAG: BamA/TamA family outer membrane protein [Thermodesulfobacteriota bacterium]